MTLLTDQTNPNPVERTSAVLCIAAILGIISIFVAYHKTHAAMANGKKAEAEQTYTIISPTKAQWELDLPIPPQRHNTAKPV
jgi:hypothetical protein